MADYSYLMQGMKKIETESSVLVSSSRYLNDARVRDWVSTHLLRKNGSDIPTPSDSAQLIMMLRDLQDIDHINALIAQERAKNAELDAWFSEGFVSTFGAEDLKQYAPETVGGIFYAELMSKGMSVNIVPPYEPDSDYEYFQLRAGQVHDFEHIVGGGGFDFIGELVPYYMRLTNLFVHMSPELASELSVFSILASTRVLTRAVLHYPETWLLTHNASLRGSEVGRNSAPLYLMKYEDVFHLTPADACKALGIHAVETVDTGPASDLWV